MRIPSESELLSIWERAAEQDPVDRALMILRAACPDRSADDLAHLPIGARDALLLELRMRMFGPDLRAVGQCPSCDARVEYALDLRDMMDSAGGDATLDTSERREVTCDGCTIRIRLPDSADLAAIAHIEDVERARAILFGRCVLEATAGGRAVTVDQVPSQIVEIVSARLAELDPLCELRIELSCPGCSREWSVLLDIVALLWTEWTRLAGRLLHEVHLLARAYAWSESDILAMGPVRRRAYLEMLN
jgi:hypothetical protein